MNETHRRILIVSVNWMGDLLFMTPAIRAIRRAYPESTIACLVTPRGLDFLKGNPHLDEVIPLEEERGLKAWRHWGPLVRRLREGRFDTAYLFHRSFTRAALTWAAGIPIRIGYRTWKRGWLLTLAVDPPPKDSVHKADWFLWLLKADGIGGDGRHYDAGVLPEDEEAADRLLRELGARSGERMVALHAGANWRLKRWPADRFARLADGLAERYGVKPLFIGGEGDLPLVQGILARMKTPAFVAAGRTTFRQLGALLARTSLVVSNDSGPLHMGVAVGTPVVALFGPTDPALTGPMAVVPHPLSFHPGMSRVAGHPLAAAAGPPADSRAEVLFGSIGCPVPCYQLRCPANLCMHQITVEQVLEAAGKFL